MEIYNIITLFEAFKKIDGDLLIRFTKEIQKRGQENEEALIEAINLFLSEEGEI